MSSPRVFFLCPSIPEKSPRAGLLFAEAALLRKNGLDSRILLIEPRRAARALAGSVPVLGVDAYQTLLDPEVDFTLIPDFYPEQRELPLELFPGRKVLRVLEGMAALDVLGSGLDRSSPLVNGALVAAICSREADQQLLRWANPKLPSYRVQAPPHAGLAFTPPSQRTADVVIAGWNRGGSLALAWILKSSAERRDSPLNAMRCSVLHPESPEALNWALRSALCMVWVDGGGPLSSVPGRFIRAGGLLASVGPGPHATGLPRQAQFRWGEFKKLETTLDRWSAQFQSAKGQLDRRAAAALKRLAIPTPAQEERALLSAWRSILQLRSKTVRGTATVTIPPLQRRPR